MEKGFSQAQLTVTPLKNVYLLPYKEFGTSIFWLGLDIHRLISMKYTTNQVIKGTFESEFWKKTMAFEIEVTGKIK